MKEINNNFTDRFLSLLLSVLFIVMIIICCIFILIIFFNLIFTNNRIVEILSGMANYFQKNQITTAEGELNTQCKLYLERLEQLSRGAADTNITSFFLQLFTTSLVSAGIYLLNRSNEKIKNAQQIALKTEKIASRMEQFVNLKSISFTILNSVIDVDLSTCALIMYMSSDNDNSKTTNYIVTARQSLSNLENLLKENDNKGIELNQYGLFLDMITNIINRFNNLPVQERRISKEIIEKCEDCKKTIENNMKICLISINQNAFAELNEGFKQVAIKNLF